MSDEPAPDEPAGDVELKVRAHDVRLEMLSRRVAAVEFATEGRRSVTGASIAFLVGIVLGLFAAALMARSARVIRGQSKGPTS